MEENMMPRLRDRRMRGLDNNRVTVWTIREKVRLSMVYVADCFLAKKVITVDNRAEFMIQNSGLSNNRTGTERKSRERD